MSADKLYYLAYEKRYRTAYDAGAERWGHSPDDETLCETLREWVDANDLYGKRVIEFACGEGAGGVILSKLGCIYHGVDIAPSAVAKTAKLLEPYSGASVSLLDMVKETTGETFDGALDCMGFHMLVTDSDRAGYLKNARAQLKPNAPMLFFRESYRDSASGEVVRSGIVNTYDDWKRITGVDYDTPSLRRVNMGGGEIEVEVPLVPARANDRAGYYAELESAGFTVERFIEMDESSSIRYSATIHARNKQA